MDPPDLLRWKAENVLKLASTEACLPFPINIKVSEAQPMSLPQLIWHRLESTPQTLLLSHCAADRLTLRPQFSEDRVPMLTGSALPDTYLFSHVVLHAGGSLHTLGDRGDRPQAELHVICKPGRAPNKHPQLVVLVIFLEESEEDNPDLQDLVESVEYVREVGSCVAVYPQPLRWLWPSLPHSGDYLLYWGCLHAEDQRSSLFLVSRQPLAVSQRQLQSIRQLGEHEQLRVARKYDRNLLHVNPPGDRRVPFNSPTLYPVWPGSVTGRNAVNPEDVMFDSRWKKGELLKIKRRLHPRLDQARDLQVEAVTTELFQFFDAMVHPLKYRWLLSCGGLWPDDERMHCPVWIKDPDKVRARILPPITLHDFWDDLPGDKSEGKHGGRFVELENECGSVVVRPLVCTPGWVSGGPLPGRYWLDSLHLHWGPRGAGHAIGTSATPLEVHAVCYLSQFWSLERASKSHHGVVVLCFKVAAPPDAEDNPQFENFLTHVRKVRTPHSRTRTRDCSLLSWLSPVLEKQSSYFLYPGYGLCLNPQPGWLALWLLFTQDIQVSVRQAKEFQQVEDNVGPVLDNSPGLMELHERPIFLCHSSESNEVVFRQILYSLLPP